MGEYILYHVKIWTAEKDAEWADAMWVSGDKILAVGAYQDMEDVASAHVGRIDMNGQMIIPYQIGSLAKGKKANFCVLNRNVFEVPVDKLGTTAAVTVVFEGSLVKGGLPY